MLTLVVSGVSLGFEIALALETTHTYIYIMLGCCNVVIFSLGFYLLFEKFYPEQLSSRFLWFVLVVTANMVLYIVAGGMSQKIKSKDSSGFLDLTGLVVFAYVAAFGALKLFLLIILVLLKRKMSKMFESNDEEVKLIEYSWCCGSKESFVPEVEQEEEEKEPVVPKRRHKSSHHSRV